MKKYRSSGFWGTNLDMLLRSNGIKSIVVTGCTTEGCVESTASDALFNGYYVVLTEDCVATTMEKRLQITWFGPELKHACKDRFRVLLVRCNQPLGICFMRRNGFFDHRVNTLLESGNPKRGMLIVRGRNDNSIHQPGAN